MGRPCREERPPQTAERREAPSPGLLTPQRLEEAGRTLPSSGESPALQTPGFPAAGTVRTNLCCFRPPTLWDMVTAATGDRCTPAPNSHSKLCLESRLEAWALWVSWRFPEAGTFSRLRAALGPLCSYPAPPPSWGTPSRRLGQAAGLLRQELVSGSSRGRDGWASGLGSGGPWGAGTRPVPWGSC